MTALDWVDKAAQNWATGVRAAQAKTESRREASRPVAVANRASNPRCSITGCKRSGGKRGLCPAHYELVPYSERVIAHMAIFNAQMRETSRQRRRLVGIAKRAARAGLAGS